MGIVEIFLKDSLTTDNVCAIYDIANRFDMISIIDHCHRRIQKDAALVLQSRYFRECSKSVLGKILLSPMLSCTESQLFLACMDWLKVASGRNVLTKELVRRHLGRLFYEIRFGAMKLQEFSKLIPAYGKLFTGDEYQEIIQMITSSEFLPKKFKQGFRLPYRKHNQNPFVVEESGRVWTNFFDGF